MIPDPCEPIAPGAVLTVAEHEKRSQCRFAALAAQHESIAAQLAAKTETSPMSDQDIKISLADIGALGKGGGDNSALMAMLAAKSGDGMQGGIWPILLLALLRGGGLFGADGAGAKCGLDNGQLLQVLGDIKAAVPAVASQIELAISNQTNALGLGIAGVKDAVQNGTLANSIAFANSNALTAAGFSITQLQAANQAAALTATVVDQAEKTRALIIAESRQRERDEVSRLSLQVQAQSQHITMTQTVNASAAATAEATARVSQHSELCGLLRAFGSQLNTVHQGIVQVGAGNAAIPTSTLTNVR